MTSRVPVCAMPSLDPAMGRVEIDAPHGHTVEQLIHLALPSIDDEALTRARVWLVSNAGEQLLSVRRHWSRIKPRPGVRVLVKLVPGDGDLLKNAMMIAISIGATALGQFWVGPALGGGFLGSVGAAAFAAGVTIIGGYLVNLLIPPVQQTQQSDRPLFQISGWNNTANPDGAVPSVLGKVRVAPVFAAPSYTEIVGDLQYVRALFTFGYGPVDISDIRLKDTPLSKFDEVEYEIRNGYPGDTDVTLYPQQVIEEVLGTELRRDRLRDDAGEIIGEGPETPVTRFSARDATGANVILSFPVGMKQPETTTPGGGLSGGATKTTANSVEIRIRQRPASGGAWSTVTTLNVAGDTTTGFYRAHRWEFPSRGRWEIEVTRLKHEAEDAAVADRSIWLSLQSFRPEKPLNFDKPICVLALRIKATYQINAQVDSINAIAERLLPDWDTAIQTWDVRKTRNPAAHFRHILQGPECAFPEPNSAIDLQVMQDWHDFCRIKGLKYDRNNETEGSQWDKLTEIAAAGRASPRFDGVKWGVVIDRPADLVVAHINPRNSRDFQWSRTYFQAPDAFRIAFLDETSDYQQRERVVRWPGFAGEIKVTEQLTLPGKTDPAEIWREARRRQYEIIHRPDQFTVVQDGAVRTATRGDHVKGSYDVLARTMAAHRVTAVRGNTITMDGFVEMVAGQSYAIRFMHQIGEGDAATFESVLRPVISAAGTTDSLSLSGEGFVPARDELVQFGIAGQESIDLVVAGTQAGDQMTSVLTMLASAPIIDQLTDAEVPPAWNGRAGGDASAPVDVPAIPVVTSIAPNFTSANTPDGVVVMLKPGPGSAAIIGTYSIRHRLEGSSTWLGPIEAPASDGAVKVTGYAAGAKIEMQRFATSIFGYSSAPSATFTADGASNPPGPASPTGFSAIRTGANVAVSWTTPNDITHYASRVWRGTTTNFALAADISGRIFGSANVAQTISNAPGSGTWSYWVTSENSDGTLSAPVGPVTVTVP